MYREMDKTSCFAVITWERKDKKTSEIYKMSIVNIPVITLGRLKVRMRWRRVTLRSDLICINISKRLQLFLEPTPIYKLSKYHSFIFEFLFVLDYVFKANIFCNYFSVFYICKKGINMIWFLVIEKIYNIPTYISVLCGRICKWITFPHSYDGGKVTLPPSVTFPS